MLKLLIFAPCEKVIVSDKSQSSAVGIIERIRVQVDPEKPLAQDALIPFRWGLLILWHRTEAVDQPVKYEIQIRVLRPDKSDSGFEGGSEFEVTMGFINFRQQIDNIPVFPAGSEGLYELTLSLRRVGEEAWNERARFPIKVEHVKSIKESEDAEQAKS